LKEEYYGKILLECILVEKITSVTGSRLILPSLKMWDSVLKRRIQTLSGLCFKSAIRTTFSELMHGVQNTPILHHSTIMTRNFAANI
jgi:hypothetical protein